MREIERPRRAGIASGVGKCASSSGRLASFHDAPRASEPRLESTTAFYELHYTHHHASTSSFSSRVALPGLCIC